MGWTLKKVEKETEPQCWHCSTHIKYVCWIENANTGEVLGVGRQCCSNFLSWQDVDKANKAVETLTREVKLTNRINKCVAKCSLKPSFFTLRATVNMAHWMNCVGATWEYIKNNYPSYYYAAFPNEYIA